MRYAVYLRKSRADDPNEPIAETLARHRELLEECMARLAISVSPEDVFEEVVSGDSLYARPQMLRLLEGVERGDYAGVLCVDIQRLGRGSMSDQGAILDAFKLSGTKIITPQRIYDLSDESDETYTEFETFMGRQEYKMIKRRLRRGIKTTVQGGGYIANAPYGYQKTRIGKLPSLAPVPEEADIVRLMYELYCSGMGCQHIADQVNAMGARPRRGQAFNRTTVRAILKNPVYTGKIVWDRKTHLRPGPRSSKHVTVYNPQEKWTIVPGLHQPIVSQNTFDRVQEIFAGRYHSPSFTGVIENPLAGLVVCANCGAHMQRMADRRAGPLLLCTKRGCIVSSKLALVEQTLISQLREMSDTLLKPAPGEEREGKNDLRQRAQAIDRELAKARSQDERLHDLLEQGVYDTDTFLSRHAALTERIKKLEAARSGLTPAKELDRPRMASRIQRVLDEYPSLTAGERNSMLKTVVDKVVYSKQKGAKPSEFTLEIFLLPVYL